LARAVVFGDGYRRDALGMALSTTVFAVVMACCSSRCRIQTRIDSSPSRPASTTFLRLSPVGIVGQARDGRECADIADWQLRRRMRQ